MLYSSQRFLRYTCKRIVAKKILILTIEIISPAVVILTAEMYIADITYRHAVRKRGKWECHLSVNLGLLREHTIFIGSHNN